MVVSDYKWLKVGLNMDVFLKLHWLSDCDWLQVTANDPTWLPARLQVTRYDSKSGCDWKTVYITCKFFFIISLQRDHSSFNEPI